MPLFDDRTIDNGRTGFPAVNDRAGISRVEVVRGLSSLS